MTVDHIGRYRVTSVLGQGGMGVVYAGYDDRLDRPVAIKVIRADRHTDAEAVERFRREAKAAARVSHPNICLLYEYGEDNGQPFLVMELLEGEPLSARLQRGAIPPAEAISLATTMLDALAALHRRCVIHRDLKPANVFLTPHGLKLLDFGLAQPSLNDDMTRDVKLTLPGMLIGTPQYMSPEQLLGRPADERGDVFAAAAMIYEMFAGHPAFGGRSLPEVVHAVTYAEPTPLPAFPASAALDRILRRALMKDPTTRLARAEEFVTLVKQAALETDETPAAPAHKQTRFVAMPLRILRPDPETDFLAFSVPDAVSAALSGIASVIVRTPPAHVTQAIDVRAIGRDLAVDVVLSGTIMRAGSSVRVSAQLVDATAGTLIWSDTAQAPIDDLFQLQDTLTERIVSSLSLPLTSTDRRALGRQAPANAEAYEMFMRANQLMTDSRQWEAARGLYERAVVLDPEYAPAWAGLGRARRVMAKWGGANGIGLLPQAEDAFRRALTLNPDLSIAHDLSAYVDAELGRAPEAMVRLLGRATARPTDPGVFAGLVTTLRYAGLLDESIAADRRAKALDPAQITSVSWTHSMRGDYDAAMASDRSSLPFAGMLGKLIKGELGMEVIDRLEAQAGSPGTRLAISTYRHIIGRDLVAARATLDALSLSGFADPEGWYLFAFSLASVGAHPLALEWITRSVKGGYGCHWQLTHMPAWQPLHGDPAFDGLVAETAVLVERARRMFDSAHGNTIIVAVPAR